MFRHPGRNSQYIRIKNDVLWIESHLIHQYPICPPANADLVLITRRLTLLIKGHHHYGRTIAHDLVCALPEALLPLLE